MRLSVYFAASAPCWLFHLAAHFRDRRHCKSTMRSWFSRNHLLSLVMSTSNFFYSACDNKCKRTLHRILRTATPTNLGFQSFFVFSYHFFFLLSPAKRMRSRGGVALAWGRKMSIGGEMGERHLYVSVISTHAYTTTRMTLPCNQQSVRGCGPAARK
jgi:hypothetical protein